MPRRRSFSFPGSSDMQTGGVQHLKPQRLLVSGSEVQWNIQACLPKHCSLAAGHGCVCEGVCLLCVNLCVCVCLVSV